MMKILVCGLPGSGKTTLADGLEKHISSVRVNADEVRKKYDDWDFSTEGRIRQAARMRYLSDGIVMAGKTALVDFVCPTEETRKEFGADYVIWMNCIEEGRFDDTNKMFVSPTKYNFEFTEWNDAEVMAQDAYMDFINWVYINKHRDVL